MGVLEIGIYLLLGLLGLVFVVMMGFKMLVYLLDKRAISMVKEYCSLHNFDFESVRVFPNHYMVRASKNGKSYTACFTIGDEERIVWNSFSLVDQVQKKENALRKLNLSKDKEHMSAV